MKPVDGGRRRSGGRDIAIRPAAIRLLIGGVLFLVAGATLAGWGLQARHPLAPRVLAYGVVMLGAGAICLAVGGFNAIRDLSDR